MPGLAVKVEPVAPMKYSSPLLTPSASDDDGDGHNNFQEYLANTNPLGPASALSARISGGNGSPIEISLNSSPQRFYTLYRTTDLGSTGTWERIDGPVYGTDGNLSLYDDSPPPPRGFYRVGVTLP